jgi:hypothetical protein
MEVVCCPLSVCCAFVCLTPLGLHEGEKYGICSCYNTTPGPHNVIADPLILLPTSHLQQSFFFRLISLLRYAAPLVVPRIVLNSL